MESQTGPAVSADGELHLIPAPLAAAADDRLNDLVRGTRKKLNG